METAPLLTKWTKKMRYLYTMEFYSAIKKNTILSFAGIWMELKNIILSLLWESEAKIWDTEAV
jgi:hypothetical protein